MSRVLDVWIRGIVFTTLGFSFGEFALHKHTLATYNYPTLLGIWALFIGALWLFVPRRPQ